MAAKRWSLCLASCALLAGLYLILTGQNSTDELAAAAVLAIVSTVLADILRRASDNSLRFRRIGWARLLASTLLTLVGDVVKVGTVLAAPHPSSGAFERQPYTGHSTSEPDTKDAAQAGAQAVRVLVTSVAPNAFVVSVLPAHRELLVHRLAPRAPVESSGAKRGFGVLK